MRESVPPKGLISYLALGVLAERVTDSVEELHATAETEGDAAEGEISSGSAD